MLWKKWALGRLGRVLKRPLRARKHSALTSILLKTSESEQAPGRGLRPESCNDGVDLVRHCSRILDLSYGASASQMLAGKIGTLFDLIQ
jgi:hypothetical protein